ncbi:heterokaryon incompatibility protein-domain-containing protein [Plectosphaerella cucumerina]|uniref:Heterokaryon incompatibility protein-domain-containing protein n=1 Tax=Plectosphaerella cucumerina TaxID=40658 RepID=A0A8K0T771_9PEZI|nr:heterokaryon incompatibility protein-domain-containing protein [Plectosphaerella cucumerina]
MTSVVAAPALPITSDAKSGPFDYQPLGDRQIRILRLRPSADDTSPLHGDLFISNLDDLPTPLKPNSPIPSEPLDPSRQTCYDAISYAWGPSALTDAFITPHGSIPITTSLASVLRRVRPDSPTDHDNPLFWADAICINQADTSEKEQQVTLMGAIYASAARVICDLGEGSPDAHLVLDAMANYRRRNVRRGLPMGQGDWPLLEGPDAAAVMSIPYPTAEEADATPEVEEGSLAAAFDAFLSLPWFRRLWVVQEFVLGRDAVMLLGRRRVSWGELWGGIMPWKDVTWPWYSAATPAGGVGPAQDLILPYYSMCLIRASRLADPATPHGQAFISVTKELNSVTDVAHIVDLPLCLVGFGSSAVTIPRDRYFAILGLLGPDRSAELRPDYTSPMEDITLRFWRAAYSVPTGADLLNAAGLTGREPQYPTWVRDITVANYRDHYWPLGPVSEASHNAGGRNIFSATFFDDDPHRMFVRAHCLDVVTDILPTSEEEPFASLPFMTRLAKGFSFFAADLRTVDSPADMRYPYTGEHIHEAAWKTMSNHHIQDTKPGSAERFDAAFKMSAVIPLLLPWDLAEGTPVNADYWNALHGKDPSIMTLLAERFYTLWGMRFCRTRKGYFAALHKDVRVGDSVWILAGCRLPTVLRPSTSHPGCYESLSGGYVHGFMNEEVTRQPGFKWQGLSLR